MAYVRHQFPFLGVKARGQRTAVRAALSAAGWPTDEHEVVAAIDALWARPEREHRYAGCHLAGRFARKASPEFVGHVARWITTDPWWAARPSDPHCTGKYHHDVGELPPFPYREILCPSTRR